VYDAYVPLVIKARVFGLSTRRPLAFVCINVCHVSSEALYDCHEVDLNVKFEQKTELTTHGRSSHFDHRARSITDERGRYEYKIGMSSLGRS